MLYNSIWCTMQWGVTECKKTQKTRPNMVIIELENGCKNGGDMVRYTQGYAQSQALLRPFSGDGRERD